MTYTQCYFQTDEAGNNICIGFNFTENFVKQSFPSKVKTILYDEEGTETLVEEFGNKTGFDDQYLTELFSLTDDFDEFPEWKIGEAFTEVFLEKEYGVRFYYNYIRDAKNIKSSQTGADLVGFMQIDNDTVFLFGETKTSYDKNVPPSVLYSRKGTSGGSGLREQLDNLKNDVNVRNKLIRYLAFKVKPLPEDNEFRIDFLASLNNYKKYGNKRINIIGVLVRDTEPNIRDIQSSFNYLIREIDDLMKLKLIALYIPVDIGNWNDIINNGDEIQ